jgi:uncharacterized protein (DUF952 family)
LIIHITSRKAWDEAQKRGDYSTESLATVGFIHCSTVSQVLSVAENFYKGQRGLVLLAIEPTLLTSDLKWEPPSGGTPPPGVLQGDPFPHIYGPINLAAVAQVVDFEPDADGQFQMPRFS